MRGVAPYMRPSSSPPLLGGGAEGRSLGFLLNRVSFPTAVNGGFLLRKKTAENAPDASGRKR
jgi:hypothetical protein